MPWPVEIHAAAANRGQLLAGTRSVGRSARTFVQAAEGTIVCLPGCRASGSGSDARGVRGLRRHDRQEHSVAQLLEHWLTRRWPRKPPLGEAIASARGLAAAPPDLGP